MKRGFGWALLGWVVFAGCGGSTDGGGSSATPVAKEDFPAELARAVCNNIGSCCQQAGYVHDAAKCATLLEGMYGKMTTGAVQYDAQKGGECVAYAVTVVQKCGADAEPGPCGSVTTGTIPAGGKCQSSAECIAPSGGDADCNDGVCVQQPRGKAGDGCSGTCTEDGNTTMCSGGMGGTSGGSAICYTNDGLVCRQDGKCGAAAKVGEPCSYDDCVTDAYCDMSAEKCVARVAVGGSCTGDDQCADGAYCAGSKCVDEKPQGATCAEYSECESHECEDGKCGSDMISKTMCSGTAPTQ
ncbi:MAG: hypothetical protein HYZ29_35315 [Myxococcales bacterium]|nr:hypothetical protein [Myxococcales bacterium]